jgi:DNA-binding response OmpR family regulator
MDTTEEPLILVIDELPAVVKLVELELRQYGMRVNTVLIDDDPVECAQKSSPDAIVFGVLVPTPGVYEILENLKKKVGSPVVFVTSTGTDADVALGLELGADDVVQRPFSPDDLVLRIRKVLGLPAEQAPMIERGRLRIDPSRRLVWRDDNSVDLGTTEWTLCLALARSELPIASDELLTIAWGSDYAGELKFLSVWIRRLRVKLGDDPDNPQVLLGDLGDGFYFAAA